MNKLFDNHRSNHSTSLDLHLAFACSPEGHPTWQQHCSLIDRQNIFGLQTDGARTRHKRLHADCCMLQQLRAQKNPTNHGVHEEGRDGRPRPCHPRRWHRKVCPVLVPEPTVPPQYYSLGFDGESNASM